jgi:hypothetical protein
MAIRVDPRLAEHARAVDLTDWVRVFAARHRADPLGTARTESRFASAEGDFTVLYAARDLSTGIAEAVIRDRFEGGLARRLPLSDIELRAVATLAAAMPLQLLDLRGAAPFLIGVDTDAPRARDHRAGRRLSEEIHRTSPDIDGLLYASRLTGGDCAAIYDRAKSKAALVARDVVGLDAHPGVLAALRELRVTLF